MLTYILIGKMGSPPPQPRRVYDLVVRLDYGQFALIGGYSSAAEDPMELLERAIAGQRIASNELVIIVLSPHQNNFQMPLRVEVWDHRPPDDQANWEEVCESGLTVTAGEVRYESAHINDVPAIAMPNGRYAVRICGRGFVNNGWPGSITPGDRWRIQLWPGVDTPLDRRIKLWSPPTAEPPADDNPSLPDTVQRGQSSGNASASIPLLGPPISPHIQPGHPSGSITFPET